jgi:hypothetical protein
MLTDVASQDGASALPLHRKGRREMGFRVFCLQHYELTGNPVNLLWTENHTYQEE